MMKKHTQQRQNNDGMNEKGNPKFKWVSMLHVLDYHRWHHVKKIGATKKHHKGVTNNTNEIDTSEADVCGPYSCPAPDFKQKPQANVTEEHITDPVSPVPVPVPLHLTGSCSLDSSPRSESSPPPLPSSGGSTSKSSRAKRLRKMIIKEVSKRTGRHRRSHTCPAGSEMSKMDASKTPPDERALSESVHNYESRSTENDINNNNHNHNHNQNQNQNQNQNNNQTVKNKCDLCTTRQIECHLGLKHDSSNHNQEGEKQQQIDHLNKIFQEIREEAINNPDSPHYKNMGKSVSFQNSKEFMDAMDVLSVNKHFFLRILEDPEPSLRHHFLTQQAVEAAAACSSNTRKSLMKSETFPSNEPSSSTCPSPNILNSQSNKTFSKENSFKQQANGEGAVGKKFKDLGQKIKHLITESRKERRRIAMDAVLHKVPYGKKVSEDSPRVSTCESDASLSPIRSTEEENNVYKKDSPSLDQSLDRYSQLYKSTTFRRYPRADSPERSTLRVMDGNSAKHTQRDLRRILSSPDLQGFFGQQIDDYNGYLSSRTPNRRLSSFNVQDVYKKSKNSDGLGVYRGKKSIDNSEEDMPFDDDVGNTSKGDSDNELADLTDADGNTSEDHSELAQGEGLIDDESPTFACMEVDNDPVDHLSPMHHLQHSHRHLQVDSKDEAEFNYVKDILQLSGYSGTQLLGTWYSSEQPVDPSVYDELESGSILNPECSPSPKEGNILQSNHLLLFDLINEVLLKIYERSISYWPSRLCSCSYTHPMPKGYRVLEEVWACINWYMSCSKSEVEQSMDFITTRDLAKDDAWMNLQFDDENVALEVEDLIFHDLLSELIAS